MYSHSQVRKENSRATPVGVGAEVGGLLCPMGLSLMTMSVADWSGIDNRVVIVVSTDS